MKIQVKPEGMEEYWAQEYKCPYCKSLGMHFYHEFCHMCGKSFKDVEFISEKE